MDHREKRRRLDDGQSSAIAPEADRSPTATTPAMSTTNEGSAATGSGVGPSTTPDQSTWQGWAEIENDPMVFNIMLREWGVRGIQVNEVVPLEAIYDSTAAATYGLIFLSRYSTDTGEKEEVEIPDGLWFANQISTYSCGTIALMNIIANLEAVDLGPQITPFVANTAPMSSKDKGLALDSFEHVRKTHNSFATLLDMKSVDRRLSLDVKAHKRKQTAAAAKTSSSSSSKKGPKRSLPKNARSPSPTSPSTGTGTGTGTGYHFIAYVPAAGHLWRMDGLEREPQSLAPLLSPADNWLDLAVVELGAQLQGAAEQNIEFSLLSLVAAPVEAETEAEKKGGEAERMREDWGPALAELVKVVAERE